MNKQELAELLTATFVTELDERVDALDHDLLALEKHPAPGERSELLKTLFRSAHSLKGAARSVSVHVIESACHCLEEVLTSVRDGRLSLDPQHFGLLFSAVDAIREAGLRLRDHREMQGIPLEAVLPQLEQAAKGEIGMAAEAARARTAEPSRPTRAVAAPSPPAPSAPAAREPSVAAIAPAPLTPVATAPATAAASRTLAAESMGTVAPPPKRPAGGSSASSVRVAAEKLDSLLAQSGELLVARRRVESRAADIEKLREEVAGWVTDWRKVEGALRNWLASAEKEELAAGDKPRGMQSGNRIVERTGSRPHGIAAMPSPQPTPGIPGEGDSRHPDRLSRRVAAALGQQGNRLRQLEKSLERLAHHMVTDSRALAQAGALLDGEVHRVRMLRFGDDCQGLERAVRDVARACGKEVELVVEGMDVEVDRSILEGLRDPLLHLVRNAVDHGVEPPDKRLAAGKPAQARITVSAALRGSQMEVVVGDDGGGLSLEAIRAQAAKRGIAVPQDDRELPRVLFMPGFSTAPIVTELSGRGVGLDVVKSSMESLRGAVEVVSEPGMGTRFILTVPLTLTTIAAVLVKAAGQTLALPGANVRALVRCGADSIRRVGGREVLMFNGDALALASLAGTLGFPRAELPAPSPLALAVIVSAGDKRTAFLVDEVLEEQTIVVKSLGARIRRVRHVSGATLLPSGTIALLLNAANLVESAASGGAICTTTGAAAPAKMSPARQQILVAEDSLTTRTLVKSILESHGYQVVTATDGQEAWSLLQEKEFHLLVSDIEMPRMDGFSLTAAIRGSKRLAKLPVVLVTALSADRDKARGIEVGADAYLVKSGFDQSRLLETIAQLL